MTGLDVAFTFIGFILLFFVVGVMMASKRQRRRSDSLEDYYRNMDKQN